MATKTTRSQLVKELNEGQRFGDIAWWTLEDVSITRLELEALFAKHELDPRHLPPPIVAHATFRQAVAAHSHNRRKKGRASTMMVRPVLENAEEIIYAVVDEAVVEDQETLTHTIPHRIIFKKRLETVHLRGGATLIGKAIKTWYEDHHDRYNTTDLRRMLVKVIVGDLNGLCLKPKGGGFYFIPSLYGVDLRKLQSIVNAWPGTIKEFGILEQSKSEANQAQLSTDAKKSLDQEVQELIAEVTVWQDKAPRRDTMQRRLKEYGGLKDRLHFFRDLLGVTVGDMEMALKDLDVQVNALLSGAEVAVTPATKRRDDRRKRRDAKRKDGMRVVRKATR